MKKALFLISLIIAALGITAHAQAEDFMYEIVDNEAVITKYVGEATDVVIPNEIEGYNVTRIEKEAFKKTKITSVVMPDCINYLGEGAFHLCEELESVTLSKGIDKIEGYTFLGCRKLTSIELPETVTDIGTTAFGNTGLVSVIIPEGVVSIGEETFWNCRKLENANIPQNLVVINDGVFSGCENLTEIVIPPSVKAIGRSAFYGSGIVKITVPNSVETIGPFAFNSCKKLEEVILPEGITMLDVALFKDCVNLKKVNIPQGVTTIGREAFQNCESLTEIVIPDGVADIEMWAFANCKNITAINIPKSLRQIKYGAFVNLASVKEIIIPEGVTKIESEAFSGCDNLEKVIIPETVTFIGMRAFYENSSLAEIKLPENVETIEAKVFNGCSSLKEISLSAENAFYTEKDGIVYNKDMTIMVLATPALSGKVTIPDTVTEIPEGMFEGSKITEVIIPDSVTKIGYNAFANSSELTKVTTPYKVERISAHTFENSKKLSWVVLGEGVTHVASEAFYNCEVENVVFKNKDTKIQREYWYTTGGINSSYTLPVFEGFCHTNVGTVYGYVGSDAQTYANERGFNFVDIETVDINSLMAQTDNKVKNEITIMINGKEAIGDSAPYIKNDRTLVPMRLIFEALGAEVSWDDATKTAIGKKGNVEVKITIGENVLYKNGDAIELDCAAEITNDRTMVPVRAISEAFGCTVEWNNETKTVEITS